MNPTLWKCHRVYFNTFYSRGCSSCTRTHKGKWSSVCPAGQQHLWLSTKAVCSGQKSHNCASHTSRLPLPSHILVWTLQREGLLTIWCWVGPDGLATGHIWPTQTFCIVKALPSRLNSPPTRDKTSLPVSREHKQKKAASWTWRLYQL